MLPQELAGPELAPPRSARSRRCAGARAAAHLPVLLLHLAPTVPAQVPFTNGPVTKHQGWRAQTPQHAAAGGIAARRRRVAAEPAHTPGVERRLRRRGTLRAER
jgi:hypothetical protein